MSTSAPLRTAEIIAVGSELLGSTNVDTNSLFIAERLARVGVELHAKAVVGDEISDLASIFRQALARADVLILTGGLGPTDDDLTRIAVADVLGLPLDEDPAIVQRIADRFAARGLQMPATNRRQALVPRGATVLENPNGTAPGLLIEHEGRIVALLPGPPREMKPMFEGLCDRSIAPRSMGERLFRATLFIAGRGESHVEEKVQPIYSRWRDGDHPIVTTILAAPGQVELHLTTRDRDPVAGQARIEKARDELLAVLGDDVFSTDGRTMEEIVGTLLADRHYTFAAAESCTGGLLTSRLTDVAGSSAYVHGAVVAYDNDAKVALLGVPRELIDAHGAVSEPVAVAMAEGIRARTKADVAAAITGIAGPGGGTPTKPVGTVVIAVICPDRPVYVRAFSFFGGRPQVKFQSAQAAMDRVRRMLTGR